MKNPPMTASFQPTAKHTEKEEEREDVSWGTTLNINANGPGRSAWHGSKLSTMYVKEATEHDNAMIRGSHDALDVLLIMAGLFSAVLTAFLIETYGLLQPDHQQATVDLLAMIAVRMDVNLQANMSLLSQSASAALPGSKNFVPTPSAWVVNLLWFVSLVCSLSAAFMAMLAKQWLQAYTIRRHGRVDIHARQRHFRYTGFLSWKTSEIIYGLPVLLQFAFVLFFVGLDILLFSIDKSIGYIVTLCTGLLLAFYIFTTLAPLFDLACPYRTPFSLSLGTHIRRFYYTAGGYMAYLRTVFSAALARAERPAFSWILDKPVSHAEIEYLEIGKLKQSLDLGIVEWLVSHSHIDDVQHAALVSISALRPNFSPTKRLRDSGAIQHLVDLLDPCFNLGIDASAEKFRELATKSLPYLASLFCSLRFCTMADILPVRYRFGWRTWIVLWGDFTLERLVNAGWNPDVLAIYLCASSQCNRAEMRRPNNEFKVMLELLDWHACDKIKLSDYSVWALVDSIASWGTEFKEDSLVSVRPAVTSCLLKLLGLPYRMGDPITGAIGVAMGVFVLNLSKHDVVRYQDEDFRRTEASNLVLRGVIDIMKVNLRDNWSRYQLSPESYETGGIVICKLVNESNFPLTQWPREISIILLKVLKVSKSELLIGKALETLRHLLTIDSQASIPILLSSVFPFLSPSFPLLIQIRATQVVGEMIHWSVQRKAIKYHPVVDLLIKNLASPSDELSNASSIALLYLARNSEGRESMMDKGLAGGLKAFFASNNASPQTLAHWSWLFVDSSWGIRRCWRVHTPEFKDALHQLHKALDDVVKKQESGAVTANEVTPTSPSTLKTREARRIMCGIKELLNTRQYEPKGPVIKPSKESLNQSESLSHQNSSIN